MITNSNRYLHLGAKVLTACLIFVAACKKGDTQDTLDPKQADTILTEQKLAGKWEVSLVSHVLYDSTSKVRSTWDKIRGSGFYRDGFGPIGTNWLPSYISFMTFNADHTFAQSDSFGSSYSYMVGDIFPAAGNWSIQSSSAIKLTTLYDTIANVEWLYQYRDGILGLALDLRDTLGQYGHGRSLLTITLEKH